MKDERSSLVMVMTDRDGNDKQWAALKRVFPVGHKFRDEVVYVKPFGIFIHLGYQGLDNYQLKGIVDIATKPDRDSFGLPDDVSLWPQAGQQVHCKVVAYREYNRQVDLRLLNGIRKQSV